MKRAAVVIAGSGEVRDIDVMPGTTAGDVLRQLGLEGFVLGKDSGRHMFGETESIYGEITDGEKLHAIANTKVGGHPLATTANILQ